MSRHPEYVIQEGPGRYKLLVWVQPGAKRNQLSGCYQGHLKIKIKARPVENQANNELLNFVAKELGLKNRQLSLASGQGSRKKILLISVMQEPDWDALGY